LAVMPRRALVGLGLSIEWMDENMQRVRCNAPKGIGGFGTKKVLVDGMHDVVLAVMPRRALVGLGRSRVVRSPRAEAHGAVMPRRALVGLGQYYTGSGRLTGNLSCNAPKGIGGFGTVL